MKQRDRLVLSVLAFVALVVGGWMFVVAPRRNQANKLASQVASVQAQVSSVAGQLSQDTAAQTAFKQDYATLARLGEAVPTDDEVPSLIVQIQSAASATHVDFESLQLGGGTSSTSTSTAATGSAAQLPPGVTVGPAGFPIEPFTFNFRGSFFHLGDFLGRIEHFVVATNNEIRVRGRLMTVNAINFGAAPQGFPMISATVTATTYLLPTSQGLTAGATPAGPATPTGQAVTTSSSTSSSSSAAPAVALPPTVR